MKKRSVSILLALGLVMSAFVAALGPASADHAGGDNEVIGHAYLPWVPNGAMLGDQGPFYGTVTVQNVEAVDTEVDIYVGVGTSSTNYEHAETVALASNESITLSADALDIPADGASVAIYGFLQREEVDDDDDNGEVVQEALPARIAAVAKNVSPSASGDGSTHGGHVTVDGYSGLTRDQIESDDNQFVLPIVQTNDGWDTTVRVANLNSSGTGISNASVTLYEAGGQGFGGESAVINLQVRPGGVESFQLSDYVEAGWVGSAFITSSADIGAVAERHKSIDDMLVTNVSRPLAQPEQTTQYAPLVFRDYNFWNTGISVANTSVNQWNQVAISYYGPTGNVVGSDTLNIPPRGMEFVFTPGTQDLGLGAGFVGSAVLTGSQPFHAAIDQVKYYGVDPDVGQAMSYVVEPDAAGAGDTLALPLAQKGIAGADSGDNSGIQLFNGSAGSAAEVAVTFYSAAGIPVAPTVTPAGNPAAIVVELSAHQNYTLYSQDLGELSGGYQGSVTVEVRDGENVTAVSNNVNYDVAADGSAAFNLVRVEPRVGAELLLTQETDTNIVGDEHTVTATLLDQFGVPVEGEIIDFDVDSEGDADPAFGDGLTDANGETTFTYVNTVVGVDTITATFGELEAEVTKTWEPGEPDIVFLSHEEEFDPEVIEDTNLVTDPDHTVYALVLDIFGNPVADGTPVDFVVTDTDDSSEVDSGTETTTNGIASFTYDGPGADGGVRTDSIIASWDDFLFSNVITKFWELDVQSLSAFAGFAASLGSGEPWDGPGNATGDDDTTFTFVPLGESSPLFSQDLELDDFNFNDLPADAEIQGLELRITRSASVADVVRYEFLQIFTEDDQGSDLSGQVGNWSDTQETDVFGGPDDLLGFTDIDASDISSLGDFGVEFYVEKDLDDPAVQANVYVVEIIVYFTTP